jgi:hypothetical protein
MDIRRFLHVVLHGRVNITNTSGRAMVLRIGYNGGELVTRNGCPSRADRYTEDDRI